MCALPTRLCSDRRSCVWGLHSVSISNHALPALRAIADKETLEAGKLNKALREAFDAIDEDGGCAPTARRMPACPTHHHQHRSAPKQTATAATAT